MAKEQFAVWHQRDGDGMVEGVFASPVGSLYENMMAQAQEMAASANEGVVAEIDDSDEDMIFVEFSGSSSEDEEGAEVGTETLSLSPGVPTQPFDMVYVKAMDNEKDGMELPVKEQWQTWSNVPDLFEV